MSDKIRAIITTLRLDKLVSEDPLTVISFYMMIALNIIMMAFIVWIFKWFLFISY